MATKLHTVHVVSGNEMAEIFRRMRKLGRAVRVVSTKDNGEKRTFAACNPAREQIEAINGRGRQVLSDTQFRIVDMYAGGWRIATITPHRTSEIKCGDLWLNADLLSPAEIEARKAAFEAR